MKQSEIEGGVIVSEIRSRTGFWKQFGISLMGGFAGAFIFGLFLIGMLMIVNNDVSPIVIGGAIKEEIKENFNASE